MCFINTLTNLNEHSSASTLSSLLALLSEVLWNLPRKTWPLWIQPCISLPSAHRADTAENIRHLGDSFGYFHDHSPGMGSALPPTLLVFPRQSPWQPPEQSFYVFSHHATTPSPQLLAEDLASHISKKTAISKKLSISAAVTWLMHTKCCSNGRSVCSCKVALTPASPLRQDSTAVIPVLSGVVHSVYKHALRPP